MTLPLEGIKVLDLSRLLPGPYATLVLADYGAQVDKVEDFQGGDYARHMPPMIGDESAVFLSINRNKRSLSLDLKNPEGLRAFRKLLAGYDVLVDQFRPGVLARLGISHEALLEANPRLVICAITGYGQTGPLATRAGHDLNYLARSGVLGFTGPKDAPPTLPGFQLADVGGALWAVIGIFAALAEREKTGKGKLVDVSMTEASTSFAAVSFGLLAGGHPVGRGDEALTGGLALYNSYATKDGRHVTLGALEPKFWIGFATAVGLEPELSALMPGPHQAALKAELAAIFAARTLAEWRAFSDAHDVCLEPVLSSEELEADSHLKARGLFFEMDSPWGTLKQMRLPVRSERPCHAPPPKQGEHTRAVLRDAGFEERDIDALVASKAVR